MMARLYTRCASSILLAICFSGLSLLAASATNVLKELADLHARTGLSLVYAANGEVLDVSFLSRNLRPVQGFTSNLKVRSGTLSPDGKKIAFPYSRSSGNPSGVSEKSSTTNAEGEVLAIMLLNGTGLRTYENIRNPQNLCWSPSQEFLALTATLMAENQRRVSVLLAVTLSTGAVQEVAEAGLSNNPCWSSDG
jgi:Tol biopolymer transport system component